VIKLNNLLVDIAYRIASDIFILLNIHIDNIASRYPYLMSTTSITISNVIKRHSGSPIRLLISTKFSSSCGLQTYQKT
jgi:hypothetical protein